MRIGPIRLHILIYQSFWIDELIESGYSRQQHYREKDSRSKMMTYCANRLTSSILNSLPSMPMCT